LEILRPVIIGFAEAGHSEIGERPHQEKSRHAFPPSRLVREEPHRNEYDTLPLRRFRTIDVSELCPMRKYL
jgi:hypothetical protein